MGSGTRMLRFKALFSLPHLHRPTVPKLCSKIPLGTSANTHGYRCHFLTTPHDLWELSSLTRDWKPGPLAVRVYSSNHWTSREFPKRLLVGWLVGFGCRANWKEFSRSGIEPTPSGLVAGSLNPWTPREVPPPPPTLVIWNAQEEHNHIYQTSTNYSSFVPHSFWWHQILAKLGFQCL